MEYIRNVVANRRIIIVLSLEVLQSPGKLIGNPVTIEHVAANPGAPQMAPQQKPMGQPAAQPPAYNPPQQMAPHYQSQAKVETARPYVGSSAAPYGANNNNNNAMMNQARPKPGANVNMGMPAAAPQIGRASCRERV